MRFVITALAAFAASCAASSAYGQTSQVFRLSQSENKQQLEEIARVVHGTGNIQQVSIDDLKGTVPVEGTAGQIAMADWMIHQLDLPANGQLSGVHEYRAPGAADDVVRVFYVNKVPW